MKNLVKKLMCISLCMICMMSIVGCSSSSKEKTLKVGVIQFMEHPSLNTIRKAAVKELKAKGYANGEKIKLIYKNGGGDTNTLDTICKSFKDDDVDVIVAIATPAAQAAANYSEDIPVIFAAVSDPIAAGLVSDYNKPDKNITGTSDEVQVDQIMKLALEMYPNTKTVGYLYNSGEANSVSNLKKLKAYAKDNGLSVKEQAVASTADVQAATQQLCDTCDILFSPTDNTVASAMSVVASVTKEAKKPFFSGADSMVKDGALATVGINYENLGKATGDMVAKVLDGTDVSKIKVKVFKDNLNVYVNTTTASAIGFNGLDSIKANHNSVETFK